MAAAVAALPAGHAPIDEVMFVWGLPCIDAGCGGLFVTPAHGTVTFHFRDAPDGYIVVEKRDAVVIAVSELTPVGARPELSIEP